MKNNFYNIPEDWYKEFNTTFNVTDKTTTNNNLSDPKEAFLRGNLFNNLYDQYKNYKYGNLNPTNKKEELLFNILMYKFNSVKTNLCISKLYNNSSFLLDGLNIPYL